MTRYIAYLGAIFLFWAAAAALVEGVDHQRYVNAAGFVFVASGAVFSLFAAHPFHRVSRSISIALGRADGPLSEGELLTAIAVVSAAGRALLLWGTLGGLMAAAANLLGEGWKEHGLTAPFLAPGYAVGLRLLIVEPALSALERRAAQFRPRPYGLSGDEAAAGAEFSIHDLDEIETVVVEDVAPESLARGTGTSFGRATAIAAAVILAGALLSAAAYAFITVQLRSG